MIRVLHLIVSLDRGGAEHSLLELIRAQAPDVQQSVCTIKPAGALLADIREPLEGRLYSLHVRRQSELLACTRLLALLRSLRPTLLHTWMFHANVLGRLAGRLIGVPVICGLRSDEFEKPLWRIVLDRVTNPLATHTVAVSQATLTTGVQRDGVNRGRASVIPNGVTLPERTAPLKGLSNGRPVIGAVGRLERVKDHATLVRAFAQVAAHCPAARLEIIGMGPELGEIKRLAKHLGIGGKVSLRGDIPNARSELEQWDICAQPSLSEGMPRAVLEAMAAGLPIVATDVGGVREVLNSTGLLIPPGDPQSMAQAMLKLIDDPTLSRSLGMNARQRVAMDFSKDAFTSRHFELYRTITSGR